MNTVLKTPDIPAFPSTTQKEVKKAFTILKDWSKDVVAKVNQRFLEVTYVLFTINLPINNQTLLYDEASGFWKNKYIQHVWIEDVRQADDTSTSSETGKHVTDMLVKKYNDHILDESIHVTTTQHNNLLAGVSGTFKSSDSPSKTITVTNGIITSIV